ncbi:target of Nesh-SH3-like [Syngnathus typhle]|uniref:target of Nesh-SH3-like n=1 Tax=Syngnathus typhle TaxID=161592 RepID=UPI002A6AD512|nr:target of Nesh-SH3-like [Syngnathus typhle]XP_061128204.1 target of Nesh-SH3-like [Syngnathus typhle]
MAGTAPLLLHLLLLGAAALPSCIPAQRTRVRRHNVKVKINATGDTIIMKFVPQNPNLKLEGYILGYGSSLTSKQFIPLPENGIPYQAEMDAEPKYLVAVQPVLPNDVTKHCTGKVNLGKPLNLVIGTVSPTAVLLSWGNHLKSSYDRDILDDCLEDGFYTIRYRERNRQWIYQTCPTSDTVIDNLTPDTPYEFGVRSNKDDRSGAWSKAKIQNTNMAAKKIQRPPKLRLPLVKPLNPLRPRALFPPRPVNGHRDFPLIKPALWTRPRPGSLNKKKNLLGQANQSEKTNDRKHTDKLAALQPKVPVATAKSTTARPTTARPTTARPTTARPTTARPTTARPNKHERKHTTTTSPSTQGPQQESWERSDLFQSQPTSDVDAMGKKRYVAPHVIYQTGKRADEPCSITSSLNFFPEDERSDVNVTAVPKSPPSNLTVVTVEGCPSFIILDWEKTNNDTTEYEVISTTKGPNGEKVSILTTDQTHTAVENLKPESSYEFKVKPKNDLGTGPSSEPVSFNTESADPRVSENVSGKDAIWTQFPFKADSYSDCNGKQYIKRTWYRKFVGVQLCNSLRYKIYLSDSLNGKFYNIGDESGFGEDHCQFVDSFLDGKTGRQISAAQLPSRSGFHRAVRQEPVHFGPIGRRSHISYVSWYECGTPIPGKW